MRIKHTKYFIKAINVAFFNSINIVDNSINKVYTIGRLEMILMEAKLQKWGNSSGIRIPSNLLKLLNLKPNDKVELNFDGEKITISKTKEKKISLEERFKSYKGENLSKSFAWDDPKGREIW